MEELEKKSLGIKSFLKAVVEKEGKQYDEDKTNLLIESYSNNYDSIVGDIGRKVGIPEDGIQEFKKLAFDKYKIQPISTPEVQQTESDINYGPFDAKLVNKSPQAKQNFERWQEEQASKVASEIPDQKQDAVTTTQEQSFTQPYLSFDKGKHPYDLPTKSLPKSQFYIDYVNTRNDILKGQTQEEQAETISENVPIQTTIQEQESNMSGFGKELGQRAQRSGWNLNEMLVNTPDFINRVAVEALNLPVKGVGKLAEVSGLIETSDNWRMVATDLRPENVNQYIEQQKGILTSEIAKINPKANMGIVESAQKGDWATFTRNLAGGVADSFAPSLAMMISGGTMGVGGMIGSSTAVFGAGKYAEMDKQAPDMSEQAKVFAAATNGALEGIFETYLGSGAVGSAIRKVVVKDGRDAATGIVSKGIRQGFVDLLIKHPALAPLGEGFEEMGTQIAQNFVDKVSGYSPDINIMDGVVDAGLIGALSGAVHSAPLYAAKAISGAGKTGQEGTELIVGTQATPPVTEQNVNEYQNFINKQIKSLEDHIKNMAGQEDFSPDYAQSQIELLKNNPEQYFQNQLSYIDSKEQDRGLNKENTIRFLDIAKQQAQEANAKIRRQEQIDQKITSVQDNEGNVTTTEIDGQKVYVKNAEDLGKPGATIFVRDEEGNTKPINAKKITTWNKQTPEEVKTDITNEDAFLEAEKLKQQEVTQKAADKGIEVGAEVENEFGTGTVTDISKDGVITAQDEAGQISTSTIDETAPVEEIQEQEPGEVNIDELSSEDAFLELSKTDPQTAAQILQDDINEARKTAAELRKVPGKRSEKLKRYKDASFIEAEADILENKYLKNEESTEQTGKVKQTGGNKTEKGKTNTKETQKQVEGEVLELPNLVNISENNPQKSAESVNNLGREEEKVPKTGQQPIVSQTGTISQAGKSSQKEKPTSEGGEQKLLTSERKAGDSVKFIDYEDNEGTGTIESIFNDGKVASVRLDNGELENFPVSILESNTPESKQNQEAPKPVEDKPADQFPEAGKKVKQPWEMTREEYAKDTSRITDKGITKEDKSAMLKDIHRNIIQQALSEGKTIPENVKKDYPELFDGKKVINPERLNDHPSVSEPRKTVLPEYNNSTEIINLNAFVDKVRKLDPNNKLDKLIIKRGYAYEAQVSYPNSLGEQGNYNEFWYKEKPTVADFEKDLLEFYPEEIKNLQGNELPYGGYAIGAKDENIIKELQKALDYNSKKPESQTVKESLPVEQAKDETKPTIKEISDASKGQIIISKPGATYGATNKIVSPDRYEELKQRMKGKLGNLNVGFDPEMFAIGAEMAAFHIEAGARKFSDFAKRMTDDLTDAIKPYLKSFYNGARDFPGLEAVKKEMDSANDVENYDLTNIEKNGTEEQPRSTEVIEPEIKAIETEATNVKSRKQAGKIIEKIDDLLSEVEANLKLKLTEYSTEGINHEYPNREIAKRIKKDVDKYAKTLAKALGWEHDTDKKGKAVYSDANITPIGGDATFILWKPGTEIGIYVSIPYDEVSYQSRFNEDGYILKGRFNNDSNPILWRFNDKKNKYSGGSNRYINADISVKEFSDLILRNAPETQQTTDNNVSTNKKQDDGKQGLLQGNNKRTPQGKSQEPVKGTGGKQGSGLGTGLQGGELSGANEKEQQPTGRKGNLLPADANLLEPALVEFNADENDINSFNPTQKYNDNIKAIETVISLINEKRKATAEEKEILSRYVGFGGLKDILLNPESSEGWKASNTKFKPLVKRIIELSTEFDNATGTTGSLSSIKGSILNAHFTSSSIIRSIYDGLNKLGFTGGKILEPSAGIGNFITFMPNKIKSKSDITAVELDDLTGSVLKYLHDDVYVKVSGIQDANIPNNSQDLVISNVPFGNYKIFDKTFKGEKTEFLARIHNYFFAKSIDMAREGGLIAFVTSKGVLDAPGNENLRKYINQNTEFLGAVRLPDKAFKNNANTEVVTDIIFLRKNTTRTKNNTDFITVKKVNAIHRDGEQQDVNVNQYFIDNPKNMLGNIVAGGLYSREDYTVENKSGYDLPQAIKNALPAGIYSKVSSDIGSQSNDSQEAIDSIKEGNIDFLGDKLVRKYSGVITDISINEPVEKIKHYIKLRNALMNLIYSEYIGKKDNELDIIRTELNTVYDSFVKAYGNITKSGAKIAKQDSDGYNVLSLYVNGKKDNKADIFRQRTIQPIQIKQSAENIDEAIVISLYENANIDIERVAELMKLTVPEAIRQSKGKLFEEPTGGFVTRDEYLSGNVKKKLKQAQQAVEAGHTDFQNNVDELLNVIPKDIPALNIEARLGSRWIPQETYTEFAKQIFNDNGVSITYRKTLDDYSNNGRSSTFEATNKYGTGRMNGMDILNHALMINPPVIYDTIREYGSDKRVLNVDETAKAVQKYEEIRKLFEDWIYKTSERRELLSGIYNERYNTSVARTYNGDHLNISGINGVELRKHQKDAIWMLLQNNGGIIDHLVGAGKTYVMVAGTMEMKRTGIAKKPMIIALKSTIPQIVESYRSAFPMAKILAPMEKDFQKDNRGKLFAQIANNEWDCIIISHENYGKIPHEKEIQEKFIQDEMAEVEAERVELEAAGEKHALKGLEIRLKNLEARLAKISEIDHDNSTTFEQMGVDHIMVDESQQFKNLSYVTKQRGVAGLSKAEGSKRAFNLFIGARYLQGRYAADKGITFLSGTPITNSMVEAYLLLKYLRPNKMSELGFNSFDSWATTFASPSSDHEFSVTGEIKKKTRFREFINVPELSMLYREIADIRTDENTPLDKPKMKSDGYTFVDIKMNKDQKRFGRKLMKFAKTKNGRHIGMNLTDKQEKAYMLLATNLSSKMAIDMRLINPNYAYDPNGKIGRLVDNVSRIFNETTEHKGTQLIFSDLGTPKNKTNQTAMLRDYMEDELGTSLDTLNEIFGDPSQAGYRYPSPKVIRQRMEDVLELTYDDIEKIFDDSRNSAGSFNIYAEVKYRLIEAGVPEEQIVFIHDYNTQVKKEKLFKEVQQGNIRIVLGSTQKLGTGVNVQNKIVAVHHLDVPWTPASMEQRNGRALRQGNILAKEQYGDELPVFAYATELTLDAYKYQLLFTKQKFLNQFKSGDLEGKRVIKEDDGDSESGVGYAELVAMLSGNPDFLTKAKLEQLIDALTRSKRNFLADFYDTVENLKKAETRIPEIKERIKLTKENVESITDKMQVDEDGRMVISDINGKQLTPQEVIELDANIEAKRAATDPEFAQKMAYLKEVSKKNKPKEEVKEIPVIRQDYAKKAIEIIEDKLSIMYARELEELKLFTLNGLHFFGHRAVANTITGKAERRIHIKTVNGEQYSVTFSEVPGILLNNIQKTIEEIPKIQHQQERALKRNQDNIIAYKEVVEKGDSWEKDAELDKMGTELKEVSQRLDDSNKFPLQRIKALIDQYNEEGGNFDNFVDSLENFGIDTIDEAADDYLGNVDQAFNFYGQEEVDKMRNVFLTKVTEYVDSKIQAEAEAEAATTEDKSTDGKIRIGDLSFTIANDEFITTSEARNSKTGNSAAVARINQQLSNEDYQRKVKPLITAHNGEWNTSNKVILFDNIDDANKFKESIERQFGEDDDVRFQIIGESGAANLDKAEEATTRLDNLGVAREMEKAGKDTKTILLSTGWQRGADGKWRYEVPDGKLKENYQDATNLGQAFDSPELFKAYPRLRYVKIGALSPEEEENSGSYDIKDGRMGTIFAGGTDDYNLQSVLLHEIQHAIQDIEGFARGGNTTVAFEHFGLITDGKIDLNKTLSHIESEIEKYKNRKRELIKEAGGETVTHFDAIGKTDEYRKLLGLLGKLYTWKSYPSSNAFSHDYYKRLAGEVESRNVQTRMNYTPEQRREKLLEETEDVSRKDQIFIYDSLGASLESENNSINLDDENYKVLPGKFSKEQGVFPRWKLSDTGRQYIHPDGRTWDIPTKGVKGDTYKYLQELISNHRIKLFNPEIFDSRYNKLARTPGHHIVNGKIQRSSGLGNPSTVAMDIYDQMPEKSQRFYDGNVSISDTAQSSIKEKKNTINALNTLVGQFGVPITVIHSSELSEVVGMAAKRKRGTPVAFYHNGTAYIISDKIQSVSDTKQSYLHEAILHKGLDLLFNAGPVTVLGKKYNTKNELLDEVYSRLSPELISEISNKYTGGETSTKKQQREIAEEVLAKLNELEKTPSRLQVFMDSLWKFIKKLVGFSSKQFTMTDLHKMLADHRNQVKKLARGGISESSDPKLNSAIDFFNNPNFRFRSSNPEVNRVIDEFNARKNETPPTKPKSKGTTKSNEVEKTIVTERTYKGEFSEAIRKKLEEIGLTRKVQTQKEAEQIGLDIIEEVGIDKALEAVRSGEVKGAPAGAIFHEKLKSIDSKMNAETDPAKYDRLAKEYADITEEMGSIATLYGQYNAFFNYIYQTSDLGFNAEKMINDYKEVNNGEISPELEAKFKQLEKDFREVQNKLAQEEQKVKELEEQASIDAIKASIQRQNKKKAKASDKIRETTDKLIELIDAGKLNRPGIFMAASPASLAWDLAMDTVKTAVKATGRTIEAIAKGFEAIKSTDWYKNLDANKKKQAKNAYYDYFTKADDKKDKDEKETPTYTLTKNGLKIPHSVIRDLVEQGIDNIEDLTQAVYDVIVDDLPDITEREVRDAITGYGNIMNQNQEEIEREIRKMKDLGRAISGLEDISEGKRPQKSGLQRDKPDPDQRAIHKQVREAMKLLPVDEERKLNQQKTQLDAAKQRLINQIEDLQREIDRGELTPKNARTMQEDEELIQLRKDRDAKKAEHEALFNDEDFLNKKRVELSKKAVNRRIAELEKRIADGDFAPKVRKELIADNELIKLRAEKLRIQEEYKKEMYKAKLRNRTQAEKIKDGLWDAWNITRALRATGEFSFVGIQGLINTIAHPVQAKQAFKNATRFFSSQRKADDWINNLKSQEWYPMLKESKLAITEPNAEMTAREELFYSGWTDMIWNSMGKMIGKNPDTWINSNPMRMIERAAVGYLDTQRVLRFLDGVEMLKEKGLEFNKENKQAYAEMADVINTFTGRASIGRLDPELLTKIFFSPRNWSSVIKSATPYAFYHFGKKRAGAEAWKPSVAQKMALADYSKFVGLTASIVSLIALALNGDDDDENKVELDPRSTDFGKIKIGNIHIDPWGGRIQQVVLISRIMNGNVKNSYGKVIPVGTPYKSPTKAELILQMATNKLAPSASMIYKHLSAKVDKDGNKVSTFGEPYSLPGSIKENLYPIYWETLFELAEDDITALDGLLAVYSFFGGGVNIYDNTPEKITDRKLREQTIIKSQFVDDLKEGYELTKDDSIQYNKSLLASRLKQQYVILNTRATRAEKEGNTKAAESLRKLIEDSKIKMSETDFSYEVMSPEVSRLSKVITPE